MIEYIFQKEMILIKEIHQKNGMFVIIGTIKILVLSYDFTISLQWLSCLMQKAINFNDAAIGSVKGSSYRIHFWYMSKDDAINIMDNSSLNDKRGVL